MVAWIYRMGNNMAKIAPANKAKKKNNSHENEQKQKLGILSFEAASIMSKALHLWRCLSDKEIQLLRTEVIKTEAITYLVSSDEGFLLSLACAEKLDDLNRLAGAVSRLGRRCSEPALQGFEHVYNDLVKGIIDIESTQELVFVDMEKKVRKMEKYIASTTTLHQELEILAELESSIRKLGGRGPGTDLNLAGVHVFQEKIVSQRHEVKRLRDSSLWNCTFEKAVRLLARTVCTIFNRICNVFGPQVISCSSTSTSTSSSPLDDNGLFAKRVMNMSGPLERGNRNPLGPANLGKDSGQIVSSYSGPIGSQIAHSGPIAKSGSIAKSGPIVNSMRNHVGKSSGLESNSTPRKMFKECLNFNARPHDSFDDTDFNTSSNDKSDRRNGGILHHQTVCLSKTRCMYRNPLFSESGDKATEFRSKTRLIHAPPNTLGASALALHYANVIILIEKLVRFPHLISHDARDDLYQMLPTSVRVALRSRLKSYARKLASTVYDAPLAADWKGALERILAWLAPFAHNMMQWQTEHNFEQHQIVQRSNILLLQTLYFADQGKTEATITELLVGLNYICRYEQEVRTNGYTEGSSGYYDDLLEWHLS